MASGSGVGELLQGMKPMMGHLAFGAIMFGMGGLLLSRNFTVESGDFRFSTDDDAHGIARLRLHYGDRVRRMQEHSAKCLKELESDAVTDAAKADVTKEIVGLYSAPRSHDQLFDTDIVMHHEKGRSTILVRDEWNVLEDNWRRSLVLAGVKDCVDSHRIAVEYAGRRAPEHADAWARCGEKCTFIK